MGQGQDVSWWDRTAVLYVERERSKSPARISASGFQNDGSRDVYEVQTSAPAGAAGDRSASYELGKREGVGSGGLKTMHDDSRLAIRLLTLGVALLAFGLGCHFWADRVCRTAGLAIGAVQLCRYFLDKQFHDRAPMETAEKRMRWMKSCDHLTA